MTSLAMTWPGLDAEVTRRPQALASLSARQWEPVLQQLRCADLLGRTAARLHQAGTLDAVPLGPRQHLSGAIKVVVAQHAEVRREVVHILAALAPLAIPVVLLKGAAYVAADSSAALGRVCSDIDILVPEVAIPDVEGGLMMAGWMGSHHDDYDQRYYRQWMHELPPMEHMTRRTALDVHHNILPKTVRRPPDAALLLAAARPLDDFPGAYVLSDADMVLHSMTHLLHNDELSHAMRDLSDIDLLLRQHAQRPGFWSELVARSHALHLQRNLYYGLWAVQQALSTPVPAEVSAALDKCGPGAALRPLMQALWRRGLATPDAGHDLPGTGLACFALHVRAHWLRMPPMLLAQHLSRKAYKRLMTKQEALA